MSKYVPFQLYLRVVPSRGVGKRLEYIRSLQNLARQVLESLQSVTSINIAQPGGGQESNINTSGFSTVSNGTAAVPQIGQSPAQLRIVGFNLVDDSNVSPHQEKQLYNAGEVKTGISSGQPWLNNPTTTVSNEVKALKSAIEAQIASDISNYIITVFRLEYNGIWWGDKGYHFPK